MSTSFSPMSMPTKRREVPMPEFVAPNITADVTPEQPAALVQPTGLVRPGYRDEVTTATHDGVVKAKNLQHGQVVRAWIKGEPRGGERVVDTIERIEDGAMVRVTFSSQHPTTDYKAAYRFHDESLVGTPFTKVRKVPALVAYQEV